ncbi:shikimate kinase [Aequorivita xiaoshiensis]|uniref:Shikimate kinase n=1 Tax=Aequorivita xiaoshiensis TaxID=2874476 RepID=A0A9X1U7D1_9FLAO|nr:shikimate kinase [Aequorivita xiaoshiensis]MCG2432087.1 shikimate kinase [Aequorivita xiaoshiensis]
MKIVLIGYMGSGKSAIGKKLAEVLNLPFKDLDTEIENREGTTVSEIFSSRGEIYFRKIENAILKEILALDESFVLATGGGTPCYADSITVLTNRDNVTSVYLKVPLEVLTERLFFEKDSRPLLSHLETKELLNDFIRKHLFERVYYYNQANKIVEVEDKSIDEVVKEITSTLF